MRQLIKPLFLLLTTIISCGVSIGQKPIVAEELPKESKTTDLSIASVTVVYPTVSTPPTLNTPRGTVQGNPNSATANPVTQCTVVVHADAGPDDQVVLDVTLPVGVKVRQKPANATCSACADYRMQCDGAIHVPIGHLEPGQSMTVQFTYTTPPTGGGLRNEVTASVKGARPETNVSNNTQSASLRQQ
jgi:hypothetical protein